MSVSTFSVDPNSSLDTNSVEQMAVDVQEIAQKQQNLLTITLEDYFQVGAFRHLIEPRLWDRFEPRIEQNTERTLELLREHNVKATFFVLGWNAERFPKLIQKVVAEGHEIASSGYVPMRLQDTTPDAFREQTRKARALIEEASGKEVLGFRLPTGWLTESHLWMLDQLAEEGYRYDSSLMPILGRFRKEPFRQFLHVQETPHGMLWEVPPATMRQFGLSFPIAGGNFYRQLPHTVVKHLVHRWHKQQTEPFVTYFQIWELDREQPEISAGSRLNRMRHYRRLGKTRWVMEDYFQKYSFTSIADYLKLTPRTIEPRNSATPLILPNEAHSETRSASLAPKMPVTIVIPCFNEEGSLPYLAKTLEQVEFRLSKTYSPEFLFVDDCSTDTTWDVMHAVFGAKSNCRFVQHEHNKGVAAAILTGIQAANSEVVCSIDCDCSYDPQELEQMVPLLTPDVDLVTASPYHPDGEVKNVPGWRLGLSKSSSMLYRLCIGGKLHTYTSCCRVYRKSRVEQLSLKKENFLGIAELLSHLVLQKSRIVEHPATLNVRIFGQSKMKTVKTIIGHLNLLRSLTWQRAFSRNASSSLVNESSENQAPLIRSSGTFSDGSGDKVLENFAVRENDSRNPLPPGEDGGAATG